MATAVSSTGGNRIWPNWWRMAGVDGIIWAVLFIVGALVLQGDVPARSDTPEDIRQFFVDNGQEYLVGDFLVSLGFIFFFVPYAIGLRWMLGSAEGSPAIWSWMAFAGGVIATVIGGVVGLGYSALAIGLASNEDLTDPTLRLIVDMNAVGFALTMVALALFVGAAGFVVLRTRVLWRWLGVIGVAAAALLIVGASWPIDGDDEGVLASLGFVGLPLTLLFVLLSSIGLIMMKEPPEPVA